ncbi:hypothetical protein HMPREF2698_11935 [Corynebacterium sp. HMSC072A02]|nr:hypothetical protein HMPREF2698_11935 [Corynebacterium sp. HMSC072A02]
MHWHTCSKLQDSNPVLAEYIGVLFYHLDSTCENKIAHTRYRKEVCKVRWIFLIPKDHRNICSFSSLFQLDKL